jgi:hypothetical protein
MPASTHSSGVSSTSASVRTAFAVDLSVSVKPDRALREGIVIVVADRAD